VKELPPVSLPIANLDLETVTDQIVTAVHRNYRDAVRLSAREEILAGLACDAVTAQLHCDTARFHHGTAHAYAKALKLIADEELSVTGDKEEVRWNTTEDDLGPMRCTGRHYLAFNADGP
jgi:hypothetical protein